jgi:hypothetical protein
MKLEYSRQIVEKFLNTTFNKRRTIGSGIVPCGETDRQTHLMRQIVTFRSVAKAIDNLIIIIIIIIFINCSSVDTRWQWLFYMYKKYDIDYY